jgi:hypothetical protein
MTKKLKRRKKKVFNDSFVCERGKGFSDVGYCRLLRKRNNQCKQCEQFKREFIKFKNFHKNLPKKRVLKKRVGQVEKPSYTKMIEKKFDEIFFGDEKKSKKRRLKRRE